MEKQAISLGFSGTFKILWPYIRQNFTEQFKSIWFIVFYLVFFQIVILGLPIVYATMIAVGLFVVCVGLMFFMEGLRLGLMPLGETIGAVLPRNSTLPWILLFAFLLGIGATFAEPAIAVLRQAGSGVKADEAPLLYSLLNDFADQLVLSVGIGVGCAVLLGVLRFFFGWSLKLLIIPSVSLLLALTVFAHLNPTTQPMLGLAWDCGAVTTGPVTVPLVLALGIGVCRIVGSGDSSNAGFGIVTLASLFPILAVLSLGFYHLHQEDYYGQANYQGVQQESAVSHHSDASPILPLDSNGATEMGMSNRSLTSSFPVLKNQEAEQVKNGFFRLNGGEKEAKNTEPFSQEEFHAFLQSGKLPKSVDFRYEGGEPQLVEGKIVLEDPVIVFSKRPEKTLVVKDAQWDESKNIIVLVKESMITSLRAIVPLCLFLFIALRLVLPEKLSGGYEIFIGVCFAVVGMGLFVLGLELGLSPLGTQLGSNVPSTFAQITPWGMEGEAGPHFQTTFGKILAILFGFFLGYGATLAEPALNALGRTVENITVGAFKKSLLMQAVAIGVGLGIATGVCKIAYNIPLAYLLVPPYLVLLVLTMLSSEDFVNFGWDSAGVTTGPITVPLVLAMGLGIGVNIPGVSDGFGILALASVGPIISVLTVGFIVSRSNKKRGLQVKAG